MPNQFFPDDTQELAPSNGLSTWDEIRRMADELELRIHLAGMDARDRWRALEPRFSRLEHQLKRSGRRARKAVARELAALRELMQGLRDELDESN